MQSENEFEKLEKKKEKLDKLMEFCEDITKLVYYASDDEIAMCKRLLKFINDEIDNIAEGLEKN